MNRNVISEQQLSAGPIPVKVALDVVKASKLV